MIETYEAKRKVEVLEVLRGLDHELELLIEERRIRRTSSGFVLYDALPTALHEPESLELENRFSVLAEKRNRALSEFATL